MGINELKDLEKECYRKRMLLENILIFSDLDQQTNNKLLDLDNEIEDSLKWIHREIRKIKGVLNE